MDPHKAMATGQVMKKLALGENFRNNAAKVLTDHNPYI